MKALKNAGSTIAGLVGGAIAGNFVSNKLKETMPTVGAFAPIAPIALGFLLLSNKNKLVSEAGAGMIAIGGAKLVGEYVPALSISDNVLADNVLAAPREIDLTPLSEAMEDQVLADLSEDMNGEDMNGEDITEYESFS
jgi:hypothetical protein